MAAVISRLIISYGSGQSQRVEDQDKAYHKSGIEKWLEDIEKGNVFHAKDAEDLINQCLA